MSKLNFKFTLIKYIYKKTRLINELLLKYKINLLILLTCKIFVIFIYLKWILLIQFLYRRKENFLEYKKINCENKSFMIKEEIQRVDC